MRIVPVLDLKDQVAVHAVRGDRTTYAPVKSVLAPSAEPLALAQAFQRRLGLSECYVADLDAIARRGDHGPVIRAIADAGLGVWLDAGVSTAAQARAAQALGVRRVIVGTETLPDAHDLSAIVGVLPAPPVLSLDLRQGKLLGGSPAVQALDPVEMARLAWNAGIRTVIVLDLARVGAGGGAETSVALWIRRALPEAEIFIGGGVRHGEDLRSLAAQGFDGALVATALHTGVITSTILAALR